MEATIDKLVCAYCGKVKQEVSFYIGAQPQHGEHDWVMNEGTGKISCPDCWEKGREESQQAIHKATGL